MLLINKRELNEADVDNPAVKEYLSLREQILQDYGEKGTIVLERTDFPRRDPITGFVIEAPPMVIPLSANVSPQGRGKETWAYCKGMPNLLANGLYELSQKNIQVEQNVLIDVNKDVDFAIFMLKKSPFIKSGMLVIQDPGRAAREEEKKIVGDLEIQNAIWTTLDSEKELRMVASAWGVDGAYSKTVSEVRLALYTFLKKQEDLKKSNPQVRGVSEFLASLKQKDTIMLGSVLKRIVDAKKITYDKVLRKYSVGSREIVSIPLAEESRPFAYLCKNLEKNKEELRVVLKETITRDMMKSFDDYYIYVWFGKLESFPTHNMAKTDLIKAVEDAFCD